MAALGAPVAHSALARVEGWAVIVGGLTGWRQRLFALLMGALATLAMPPFHAVPLLLIAFPALVWLIDGAATPRKALVAGWWFGLGHFSLGLYWISHALLTDPVKFGWMIPFALFGLGGILGLFPAVAAWMVKRSQVQGAGRILILAAAWTFLEWVRGWIFTGFPWNLMGSVWDVSAAMLQGAAVAGVHGLSLLTVMAAASLAMLGAASAKPWRRVGLPAVCGLLLVALWAGGSWRLATSDTIMVEDVRLRLVQANVAQHHKWQDELREAHLSDHVALSRGPGFEAITHVVWPETATPFFLDHDPVHRATVALAAPLNGAVLTGAPRASQLGANPVLLWNSLQAVDAFSKVIATYDKAHLVPFGEYVPLRNILPIAKITHGGTDFSAGPGPKILSVPGLPDFGVLICYEAIFPGAVTGTERPDWLLNITNDGWFGLSAGPHQHLASARLRAVEEGLPLVRAANTGISAIIDGNGRILSSLPLGERGILDSPLPMPLAPTLFSQFGALIPLSLCLVIAALGALLHKLHNRSIMASV